MMNVALRKYLAENELTEVVYHKGQQYRLNIATEVAPPRRKGRCDLMSKRMIMGRCSA